MKLKCSFALFGSCRPREWPSFYISHRLEELPVISDRISILRDGCYIKTVDTKDVSREALISMMAGRELDAQYPARVPGLRGHSGSGRCGGQRRIWPELPAAPGEILGFAGLVGAGRTEAMQLIYGVSPSKRAASESMGKPVSMNHPSRPLPLASA